MRRHKKETDPYPYLDHLFSEASKTGKGVEAQDAIFEGNLSIASKQKNFFTEYKLLYKVRSVTVDELLLKTGRKGITSVSRSR